MKFDVIGNDIKEFLFNYGYIYKGYQPIGKEVISNSLPSKKDIKSSKSPLNLRLIKDDKCYLSTVYVTPVTFLFKNISKAQDLDLSVEWKNFLLHKYKTRYASHLIQHYKQMDMKLLKNFEIRKQELLAEIRREENEYQKAMKKIKKEINECFKNNGMSERI